MNSSFALLALNLVPHSDDESLVAHIDQEYITADFFMPDMDSENKIVPIKYYGCDMAYARLANGGMRYTFKRSSIVGSIATSPDMACGPSFCALSWIDTTFMVQTYLL